MNKPIKIGDKIYEIANGDIICESTITGEAVLFNTKIYFTDGIDFDERAIGRSVFLSRKAAEEYIQKREAVQI